MPDRAVHFKARRGWALTPVPASAESKAYEPERELFRWEAAGRQSRHCGPYMLGRSLGWLVRAPVDVSLEPLEDIAFSCADNELDTVSRTLGVEEVWKRGDAYIGLRRPLGLRRFDFRCGDHWEPMFLPNGEGSLEWRLGFDVTVSEGLSLLVIGPDEADSFVVPGLLPHRVLTGDTSGPGFSLAIRPRYPVTIRRGDVVARLLLLDQSAVAHNRTARSGIA